MNLFLYLFTKNKKYLLTTMSTFLVFYLLSKYVKPKTTTTSTQTIPNDYEKLGQFLIATVPDESIVWNYLANLKQ